MNHMQNLVDQAYEGDKQAIAEMEAIHIGKRDNMRELLEAKYEEYVQEACHEDEALYLGAATESTWIDFICFWKASDEFQTMMAAQEEAYQQRRELEVADEEMGDATP